MDNLRALAEQGKLVAAAATATRPDRQALRRGAYTLAWPIVFDRITRRVERSRGHHACASSITRLADECIDRFHDDVESVVDELLSKADRPITNLEAWVASRLTAATVNGHRRRRGRRGAPQRPRVPGWLAAELDHDPWLLELATELLNWVGVAATAGTGTWPLDAWTRRRAEVTGDFPGSQPATTGTDVTRVLTAMRKRPKWYDAYVERPLGRKQAPVLAAATAGDHREPAALPLTEPHQLADSYLREVAAHAIDAITARIQAGADPTAVVVQVVDALFGSGGAGRHELDQPPHATPADDEQVQALLDDPGAVERIVTTVLGILAEGR